MINYQTVSPFTGKEIDEDAPANNAGSGEVSMPPDAVKRKKKDIITREGRLDGRTKSYREHRKKLESLRLRRLENLKKKKSDFSEKVLGPMR